MDIRLYVFVLFYLCTVYLTNILCMLLLESVSDPSEQVCAFIFFCLQHLCLTSLFVSLLCFSMYVEISGLLVDHW